MSREHRAPAILRSRALRRPFRSLGRALRGPSASWTLGLHDDLKYMLGSVETRLHSHGSDAPLCATEFRVFSQFGEDGIIQHLLRHVDVPTDLFVEVGVEDYRESNTRFLLQHDNWAGVVLDATRDHIRFIEESGLGWRHTIEPISVFVEPSNINALLDAANVPREFGLLSMDIDGVDYWVLDAVERRPAIVVAEYNSHFGPALPVSVPYRPGFCRTEAHHSNLYFGASLAALCHWAARSDYTLVGCTRAGNNAFFVRRDLSAKLPALGPGEAYVRTRVREPRDTLGRLTYDVREAYRDPQLRALPLVNVETGASLAVGDVLGD